MARAVRGAGKLVIAVKRLNGNGRRLKRNITSKRRRSSVQLRKGFKRHVQRKLKGLRAARRRSRRKLVRHHSNQNYNEAYQEGFNHGFAKGYEDGHQLAYAGQV